MTKKAFDSREFRGTLSKFATGVTIVTARDQDDQPIGMTASSFNSVSIDPPLILWSVTKTALSGAAFTKAEHFIVHVLGQDQIALSNKFAKSGEDKFQGVPFSLNADNVPRLDGAVAYFECKTWAVYEGGDHWIIVGEVTDFQHEDRTALVFSNGSYACARPIPQLIEPLIDQTGGHASIDGYLVYHLSRAARQMSQQLHHAVVERGLTVEEWRVLASLEGGVMRTFADLSKRTFIEPSALKDVLVGLSEAGFCSLSVDGCNITGTDSGHKRVESLLDYSLEQEKDVLDGGYEQDKAHLIALLQHIIDKTDVS